MQSILSQDIENIEVICVDDCSSDNTPAIIRREATRDPRIKPFFLENNSGAPVARNKGIRESNGEYLLFLDADDSLAPNALKEIYLRATHLGSDAIKGCMLVSESESQLTSHRLNQKTEWLDTTLRDCGDIQHMYQYTSYLFKSSVVKENSIGFNENLKNFQDPVFLAHLLPLCRRIDVILSPIYIRRVVPNSIITSNWGYANFASLVDGVSEAYTTLSKSDNTPAARSMAKTLGSWWHKLAGMPASLTKEECFDIFTRIKRFSDQADDQICEPRLGGMSGYLSLSLISDGRFEDAYRKMRRSHSLAKFLPKPLRSFAEILRYSTYTCLNVLGLHRRNTEARSV